LPSADPKKFAPPIAFAWGVLGSAIGGYFSPYSPCCFQEYLIQFNPCHQKSLARLQIFYDFFQTADLAKLRSPIQEWPEA
jgi:hypothetical protein